MSFVTDRVRLIAGLAVLGAAALYFFPPGRYPYPACPLHSLTGLYCPGCGSTRAFAALLRGDVAGALMNNALSVVLFPIAGLMVTLGRHKAFDRRAAWWLLAIAVLFTLLRNLGLVPLPN